MELRLGTTALVIRWEGDAYHAYTRDLSAPVGAGRTSLERTLGYWSTFGEYEVADVESFATDDDCRMWAERVAVRRIGRFLADPHRHGDVNTQAWRLLGQLAEVGVHVDLDRE